MDDPWLILRGFIEGQSNSGYADGKAVDLRMIFASTARKESRGGAKEMGGEGEGDRNYPKRERPHKEGGGEKVREKTSGPYGNFKDRVLASAI